MKHYESEKLAREELDQETSSSDERHQKRYLIIGASVVALILLVIAVAVWKWLHPAAATEEATAPVVSVRMAKVTRQTI